MQLQSQLLYIVNISFFSFFSQPFGLEMFANFSWKSLQIYFIAISLDNLL